jgi:hypothetical protein
VRGVGRVEDVGPLGSDELVPPVVDVGGGVEPDARVTVLVVVPPEEAAAEGVSVLVAAEAFGEFGPVLEVRNWLSLNGLSLEQCGRL